MYHFQQGTSQKCLQLDSLIVIHKKVFSLFILIPETLASDVFYKEVVLLELTFYRNLIFYILIGCV